MTRCFIVLAAVLSLALASIATPSLAQPKGDLGPFRVGMTFEEAKAVAPGAMWSEERSRATGRVISITGKDALTLGGKRFEVTLKPLAYGAYQLEALHSEQEASERGCRDVVSRLGAELEDRFGVLGDVRPLSKAEVGATVLGADIAAESQPIGMLKLGKGSVVDTFTPAETSNLFWLGGRRSAGTTVLLNGRYLSRTAIVWQLTCVVGVRITVMPPRPEFEWLDLAKLAAPLRVSDAVRRHSFDGMAALPSSAASVGVVCQIDRATARFSHCRADDGTPPALAGPAERQGERLAVTPTELDPDNDVPLKARLTLRIDPADAGATIPPPDLKPLEYREIRWLRRPSSNERTDWYPIRAHDLGREAKVTVLCRIERDGSLSCPQTTVEPVLSLGVGFERTGELVEQGFQAEPILADGSPSAGRWIAMVMNFTLAK